METEPSEAPSWNQKGQGIFHEVNRFSGPRQIAHLAEILYYAVDIDDGTKAEQATRLRRSPLRPSFVVETDRGFHVYWRATRASYALWDDVVKLRLVPFFRADPNARDVTRVLRTPGYWHQKDPRHPFLVRVVLRTGAAYTEDMMLRSWRPDPAYYDRPRKLHTERNAPLPAGVVSLSSALMARQTAQEPRGDGGIWDRIYQADQGALLLALSGRPEVGGDLIELKQNTNGTKQIHVGGKSTACWVDQRGRIGSHDKGGPSVVEWCAWWGVPKRKVIAALEQLFPELKQ